MCLDKDILVKGNKVYSPENCIIVPDNINTLFIKCDKSRGDFLIGTSLDKVTGKYRAMCNNGKMKNVYLSSFDTPQEAFNAYKTYKEQVIKDIANEYKEKIPQSLYEAMLNYTVSIDD